MRTEFGEKLQNAMDSVESYTWKDKNGNDIVNTYVNCESLEEGEKRMQ